MNFEKLIPALRSIFGAIPEIGSITIYRHSIRFDTDSDDMLQAFAEKLGAKVEIVKLEQSTENRSVWWLKAQTKIGDCYIEISGRHHYTEPVIIEPTVSLDAIAEEISAAAPTPHTVEPIDPSDAVCPHSSVDAGDEFNPDRCRSCFAPVYPPKPMSSLDDDMPF